MSLLLIIREDVERKLAASFTKARITLGETVHTNTPAARGGMDFVDRLLRRIGNGKGRNTVIIVFTDFTKILSSTAKRRGDKTASATFARTNWEWNAWTLNRQEFVLRTFRIHDLRFKRIHVRTANAQQTVGLS